MSKTVKRFLIITASIAVVVLATFVVKELRDYNRLEELRKTHPQYFNASDYGITVYVSEINGNVRCMLFPGPVAVHDQAKLREELKNAVSLDDMKLILSTYDIPDNNITVEGYSDPVASLTYFPHKTGLIESTRKKLGLN